MSTGPASPDAQAREALGARLREIRKDAGLTARALAVETGQHYTKVSKLEHGRRAPTDSDIRKWCAACHAEDQIPDLIATARSVTSAYLEYRRQTRSGMKRMMLSLVPLYEKTSLFRIYEHYVIPGLFQTAEYSAAMLSYWIDFLKVPSDIEETVAVRMERQRVIYQQSKRFAVVIEEQALRTWFGTAQTQARQLDRLLAVMTLPNVTFGIVPMMTERTATSSIGYWIFDDSLVSLETPTASIEVTRPQEIALYARLFEQLRQEAVYGPAARALITRTLRELG